MLQPLPLDQCRAAPLREYGLPEHNYSCQTRTRTRAQLSSLGFPQYSEFLAGPRIPWHESTMPVAGAITFQELDPQSAQARGRHNAAAVRVAL